MAHRAGPSERSATGDLDEVANAAGPHRLAYEVVVGMPIPLALPDGRLECSAKLDAPAIYSPMALGEAVTELREAIAKRIG